MTPSEQLRFFIKNTKEYTMKATKNILYKWRHILSIYLCICFICTSGTPNGVSMASANQRVQSNHSAVSVVSGNSLTEVTQSPIATLMSPVPVETLLPSVTDSEALETTSPPTSAPTLPQETLSPPVTSNGAIETICPPTPTPPAPEYADLRLMFTSDLHGQLTTNNYETGEIYKENTLARCATLIKEARKETLSNNTLLFDIGDALYNYTTDFIYDYDDSAVQPIYSAMASMNYDAITLGNHEFDYTLSYIQDQLNRSGLADKCVVSNVKSATTGKTIWSENKIIEKTVTTFSGSSVVIKIGILGETPPSLSDKRSSYTNTLVTEDIVQNATMQAKILKENGADIIIALSHAGIGEETPANNSSMVSYALTKIPEIDVVLCGHAHNFFPTPDNTLTQYYNLPNVEKETGLANNKNLIMIGDQGKAIGIADLTIQYTVSGSSITARSSDIRYATKDIEPDAEINQNYMGTWNNILTAQYSNVLGEIKSQENLNNYWGILEDNSVIQLLNNAKMDYAQKIVNTEKTDYANYPIIGASTYIRCGTEQKNDYVEITDNFLESYLSNMQKYKTPLYMYKINGKQLREWIEWSASAYHTPSSSSKDAPSEPYTQNILQQAWDENLSNFYIFDGVEYTIDTSQPPRYDFYGTQISHSQRVTSLTVNGIPVDNETTFILSCDKLEASTFHVINELRKKIVYNTKHLRCRTIVKEYIERLSTNSSLQNIQDYNWHLNFPKDKTYIVRSGVSSYNTAEHKPWLSFLGYSQDNLSCYYKADFSVQDINDTTGPLIISTPLTDATVSKHVSVKIQTTDVSGISSIKYAKGRFTLYSHIWNYAESLETAETAFLCEQNAIYSILATDNKGNRSLSYIRITNIDTNAIEAPTINTYTNRKTKITGTGIKNSVVYFKTSNGDTYSTTVKSKNGSFSYNLPPQNAGTSIYVYAIDNTGRTSARVLVHVARTGPNKPGLNNVNSNSKQITGTLNDTYVTPFLLIDSTMYVPKNNGRLTYETSQIYDDSYSIVEVDCKINTSGTFTMDLPQYIPGKTEVELFTIDTLGRKSLSHNVSVTQQIPPTPILLTTVVTNASKKIQIACGEKCTAYIYIGETLYKHNTVKYDKENYQYIYTFSIPKTNSGLKLKIYTQNSKGQSQAIYTKKIERVPDTPKLTSIKSTKIKGSVHFIDENNQKSTRSASQTKVFIKIKKKTYTAKVYKDGTFGLKVPKLKSGQKIIYWATNINGSSLKSTAYFK